MKNMKQTFLGFEACDIHQFTEAELAMVMGGGGEDNLLIFSDEDADCDEDDEY